MFEAIETARTLEELAAQVIEAGRDGRGRPHRYEWDLFTADDESEDFACIGIECDQYQDSGWRRPYRTREQHLETMRKTEEKLRAIRPQFGQREKFERRAMGYRA